MIPNQWYVILESNEVKPGRPVGVTRMGEKLVLWRDAKGQVTCMADLCPHRGVALSAGKLIDGNVQCPFHGFEYDTSGRCTLIPANGRAAAVPKAFQVHHVYPACESNDFIYIWWGEPRAKLPPVPFFDTFDPKLFSWFTIHDLWPTHYSRAIENQLDVVHLPFVHYNTIGRGNQTVVNGPRWTREPRPSGGDVIHLWVDNETDRGQIPLKPSEMPAPTRRPLLEFLFPNLWHNWLGDNLHIVIAFVPIDDENTMMYIRNYQRMATAPIVRDVFNLISAVGNLIIERQDKRVVITERPKRSERRMNEKLIQGDGPIIEYRRRRSELIASTKVGGSQ
jgi:phenylpropionate dioxygenase-like ring-hydroxylating dioxygenase large terminal subunit